MSAHDVKELRKCYMICNKRAMQPMLHLACIHECEAAYDSTVTTHVTMCDTKRNAGRVAATF